MATRRRPGSNGTSSSAQPCRCSMLALPLCKASGEPKDKAAVAKAMSTLKTATMVGVVDFTKGPVPKCFATEHHREISG